MTDSAIHVSDADQALEHLRSITKALRVAKNGIDQIQGRLVRTSEILDDRDAHKAAADLDGATAQVALDREIQAIDAIAGSTQCDGQDLLNGSWAASIADPQARGIRSLRIPAMSSASLGHDRIAGFLAALRTGGELSLVNGEPSQARAVIRCAMLQAGGVREQLEVFLRDAVEPLAAVLEVEVANTEAARSTAEDGDFAHQASRLTRVDALMHACTPPAGSVFSARTPSLPIRAELSDDA